MDFNVARNFADECARESWQRQFCVRADLIKFLVKWSVRSNDTSSFRLLRFAFFLLVARYRFRL